MASSRETNAPPPHFLRGKALRDVHRVLSHSRYTLNLYFVSSNTAKISHIQHLFNVYGLPVRVYRGSFRSYAENHSLDPESSVRDSVASVASALGHLGLFFVEDSTFSLSAMSQAGHEYPGLATKAFMRDHPFSRLDVLLRARSNDRRASLVSRIGLHLPGDFGTEVFTGRTEGTVSEEPPAFHPNSGIPWLDEESPANFFVPDGCHHILSNLPLEFSYDHDTRLKALHQMLFRLAQYSQVAEYSSQVFRRRPDTDPWRQPQLFAPSVLIISGYSGTGKTTAALYLSRAYGYQYLEQCDAVRAAAEEAGWDRNDLASFCDHVVSEKGPLYLIEYMLEMYRERLDLPLVISGVRNPHEVDFLRQVFPSCRVLFLDVPFDLRHARCSLAGRCDLGTSKDLRALEEQERGWGMEEIRARADFRIRNAGSIETLFLDLDRLAAKLTTGA